MVRPFICSTYYIPEPCSTRYIFCMKPSADCTRTARGDKTARHAALTAEIATIVLHEGLGDMSVRALAARLGTSDRMLLYYFTTREQMILAVLHEISDRLSHLLAGHSTGPRLSPGQFLTRVLALAHEADVAPFMQVWTDVIARGARGMQPYDSVARDVVRGWMAWIDSRLTAPPTGAQPGRAAAILSIVEGISLLEAASPGSTAGVSAYLASLLDPVPCGPDSP
ncbi:TetR family transcriptional regulator [Komagataeibacter xylinus]|uniref:TetR family transcriptional regulator n=2 Tax=Komagataeibacter xylinus TaxID=28448 RepID=A0A318PNY0_KOMXY|nr:TetR/AcrR family transcriptional regulator [Komagataeibacter xylinus]PYD57307.1 TetR family transcriptional regulator [Komagataeibacter xylinus]